MNWMEFLLNFTLEIIIGAISILIVLIIERQTRPNLRILADEKHYISEMTQRIVNQLLG